MSSRCHLAAGWCLTSAQFRALSTDGGRSAYAKYEAMNRRLKQRTSLCMTPDEYRTWSDLDTGFLMDADLLKGGIDAAAGWGIKKYAGFAEMRLPETQWLPDASGLVTVVDNADGALKLVMFFPNVAWVKDNVRKDNTLDVMMTEHPLELRKAPEFPKTDVRQRRMRNPYPYSYDFMYAATGARYTDIHAPMMMRRDDWAPAPPKALRWWLQELNVLEPDGWLALRPYLCRWWS